MYFPEPKRIVVATTKALSLRDQIAKEEGGIFNCPIWQVQDIKDVIPYSSYFASMGFAVTIISHIHQDSNTIIYSVVGINTRHINKYCSN